MPVFIARKLRTRTQLIYNNRYIEGFRYCDYLLTISSLDRRRLIAGFARIPLTLTGHCVRRDVSCRAAPHPRLTPYHRRWDIIINSFIHLDRLARVLLYLPSSSVTDRASLSDPSLSLSLSLSLPLGFSSPHFSSSPASLL